MAVVSNKLDAVTKALCRRHFGERIGVVIGDRPGLPRKPAPEGVALVQREKQGRRFVFALNYQPEPQTLTLHRPAVLLYSGETHRGPVTLPPFGTAVYELSS